MVKKQLFWWGPWHPYSEETNLKPKPMIEIGDMPILWHIMKIRSPQHQ